MKFLLLPDTINGGMMKLFLGYMLVVMALPFFSSSWIPSEGMQMAMAVGFLVFSFLLGRRSWTEGITFLLIIGPFFGYLRRVLTGGISMSYDWMHLVPMIVLGNLLLSSLKYNTRDPTFRDSPLYKSTMILLLFMALMAFHPACMALSALDQYLFLSLYALLTIVFPAALVIGAVQISEKIMDKFLWLILVISVLSGAYAMYQTYFGFLIIDERWIASNRIGTLIIGGYIRVFSFFPNPEELSRYLMFGITICWFRIGGQKQYRLLPVLLFLVWALLIVAVRSSLIATLFGLGCWFVSGGRIRASMIVRLLGVYLISLTLLQYFEDQPLDSVDVSDTPKVNLFLEHALRGTTRPFGEATFLGRVPLWTYLYPQVLSENPFGIGLNCITLAAGRTDTMVISLESSLLMISVGMGITSIFLFRWLFQVMMLSLRTCLNRGDNILPRLLFTIISEGILTSFTGNAIMHLSNGVIIYLCIGYVNRLALDQEKALVVKRHALL